MVMEDDNNINIKDRFLIASALLFHDVLEDTTISDNKLKLHISEIFQKYYNYQLEEILGNKEEVINKILDLVKQATTIGGSEKEYKYLKANEDKITQELWYLKFIDKYFNILGSKQRLTQNGKWEFYKEFLNYLASQTSKTRFKDSIWLKTVKCLD
jgi:predicted RNA-binding protein with RPS1 domain